MIVRPMIAEIQEAVCEHFGCTMGELRSVARDREIVRPRQIAMYLARKLTVQSLPEIGRRFDRDHTTVRHAVSRISVLAKTVPEIHQDIERVRDGVASAVRRRRELSTVRTAIHQPLIEA